MSRSKLALLGLPALLLVGCNPVIFDSILDDVYVSDFTLRGPSSASTTSSIGIVLPPDGEDISHLLMPAAANVDATMVYLGLNAGANPEEQYATIEALNALVFPIADLQNTDVGGLVHVPPPTGMSDFTVLAAFREPGDLEKGRIVRFTVPDFSRTDSDLEDIRTPRFAGNFITGFGTGLAAINLDADQSDPDVEVMIGSDRGPLVYDNLGINTQTYEDARSALVSNDPEACTGASEVDCIPFTLCDGLVAYNSVGAGLLLPGDEPTFVVAHEDGLNFVTPGDPTPTNDVGAPVFDCEGQVFSLPDGASEDFGKALYVHDFNGDDHEDLAVGDPGANRVFLYIAAAGGGVPSTPTRVLEPTEAAEDADEFGAALGVADLGGDIGRVLLVGAPGTTAAGKADVGGAWVFDRAGENELRALIDESPEASTRFGIWVGGLFFKERDEIVVMGNKGGRVHVAINRDDPFPGG